VKEDIWRFPSPDLHESRVLGRDAMRLGGTLMSHSLERRKLVVPKVTSATLGNV